MEPPNLHVYQLTKKYSAEIAPHVSSALRDLGVVFDIYILSISDKLAGTDPTGTLDSWYGTQNKQKNTHNYVVKG